MTFFKDLDDAQKDAIKDLVIRGVERRIQEETEYTNQVFRLLALGNGAGVVLLATFMGAIATAGNPIANLVAPLWKFFLGSVAAALIYAPLMAVAADATKHVADQAFKVFNNKMEIESLQGYGLNKRGLFIIRALAFTSLVLFAWGVYQCIRILNAL